MNDRPPEIFFPVLEGNLPLVEKLLAAGHSPDVSDPEGQGLIHHAILSMNERPELIPDLQKIIHLILEKGANPNQADIDGITPLMLAAKSGYLEVVKDLLETGADKNATNAFKMTAVSYAELFHHDNVSHLINNFEKKATVKKEEKPLEGEGLKFDVVVSGGGPSGMATALEAMNAGLKVAIISDRADKFTRVQPVGLTERDAEYLLDMLPKDKALNAEDQKFKDTLENTPYIQIKEIEKFLKRRLDEHSNNPVYYFNNELAQVDMSKGLAKLKNDDIVSFNRLVGADGVKRHALKLVNPQLEQRIKFSQQKTISDAHSSAYLVLKGENVKAEVQAAIAKNNNDERITFYYEGYHASLLFLRANLNSEDPIKCSVTTELPKNIQDLDKSAQPDAARDYIEKLVRSRFPDVELDIQLVGNSKKYGEVKNKQKHTLYSSPVLEQAQQAGVSVNNKDFFLVGDAFRTPHNMTGLGMLVGFEQARELGKIFKGEAKVQDFNKASTQLGRIAEDAVEQVNDNALYVRMFQKST